MFLGQIVKGPTIEIGNAKTKWSRKT